MKPIVCPKCGYVLSGVVRGVEGEHELIDVLRKYGVTKIRVPDIAFLHPKWSKWCYFEVKDKEPFAPPPAWMQGFPQSQYIKDIHIDAVGLPCFYVVRGQKSEWLIEYANRLQPVKAPTNVNRHEDLVWFELNQFHPLDQFLECILELDLK